MSFSINGNNGGMVVTPDHYLNNQNQGNIGAGIIDSALSNEDYGFSITDNVKMLVAAQMGGLIPDIQSQITNANIQQGALTQFDITMAMLVKNTVKPLNQQNALTSYEISNSSPNSVNASIAKNGISGDLDLSIGVKQLAQSQSLKFGGFGSINDPLKAGAINIDFGKYNSDGSFDKNGTNSSVSIEIKDGMTIKNLADEINKTSKDIKATIITNEDGSTELALISQKTGSNHAMKVSTSGDPSLSNMNYNGTNTATASEARQATDAIYSVNGIEMTSPTNKIEDVFGLNLTLNEVTTNDIKIGTTVSPNGVVDNVFAFVENYNALMDMFNSFNESTPDKDFVGSIHGTSISKTIEEEFDKLFSKISNDGSSLKDLGISRDSTGNLNLDQDKLRTALQKDPEIAYKILGTTTDISHSGVEIESLGGALNGEHSLVITRKPEQANLIGSTIVGDITLASDTDLKIKVGGKEVTVPLKAGSHKPEEVIAVINNAITKSGVVGYEATLKNGSISFSSADYGALQSIEILSDIPELGLIKTKTNGVDISGTINGESFLGDGASFESKFDSASKGMIINFDPELIVLNQKISINTDKGFLDNLSTTIDSIKKEMTPEIKEIKESLDKTKNDSLLNQLSELEDKEDYFFNMYYQQFSGVSAALSQMEGTIEMMDMMFGED